MRIPEPPLSTKALILVAVPLVFNLTFVCVLVLLIQQFEMQLANERHARDVTSHLNTILRDLMQEGTLAVTTKLQSVPRSPFIPPSDQENRLSTARRELDKKIKQEVAETQALLVGNPAEEAAFKEIYGYLWKCLLMLGENKQNSAAGDRFAMLKTWSGLNKMTPILYNRMDQLILQMDKVQEETHQQQTETRQLVINAIIVGTIVDILIALGLAWYFNKGTIKHLDLLMENSMRLASGKKLSPPIEGTDEIARLDKVFRQMAELLEEANRKQRAAFENAVDVICSIDTDGRFAEVNQASTTVWGHSPDDLMGTRISQMIFKDDVTDTLDKIKQIIKDESHGSFENRVIKSDRSLVDMEWTAQWSSKEKTLYCVAHDVTERKQIDRLKQDFVAMVSHDLRTPLTSVQGFLELLGAEAYGNLSEEGYDSLEITESSVKRLISLINDLLDLEKMESGMLELRVAKTNLANILTQSVDGVIGFAKQEGITVKVANDTKLEVEADGDRMVQVVINLLSNAIKFSPKGAEVLIDVDKLPHSVRVNIRDQGRGVPEHMRESIFERFKQVELNDERKKGGSGLGLAICKAIVERHGGTIGVEPGEDGTGSVFWFILPVTIAPKPVEKSEQPV